MSNQKINYYSFNALMSIAMQFDENMSDEESEELIQEWYVMFKQQGFETVKEFVDWNFNPKEVNKDTHPYWQKP